MSDMRRSDIDASIILAEMSGSTPTIDLHGMVVSEVDIELDHFFSHALHSGEHVVRIIHGKGKGALADYLRNTLPKHPRVEYIKHPGGGYELGGVLYVVLV
jgi:DNA-nicking Smr family endonuclease